MQSKTTINHRRQGRQSRHEVVCISSAPLAERRLLTHLLVHEPERKRLVTNERLIMTFGIRNTAFQVSTVREGVDDISHLPRIVRTFLQQFDEHVGNGHRQAVIETDTAFRDGATEGRHTADVFSDRDDVGVDLMQHVVGLSSVHGRDWNAHEHEISHGFEVDTVTKVLVVTAREARADAVVGVHHRSDAVEAEAVKHVFVHVEAQVGEQEAQDFMVTVVEQAASGCQPGTWQNQTTNESQSS